MIFVCDQYSICGGKCNIICKVEHLRKTGSQLGPLLSPRPLFKGQLSLHHLSLVIFIFWPWHFIFIPVPYLFIIFIWFILLQNLTSIPHYSYRKSTRFNFLRIYLIFQVKAERNQLTIQKIVAKSHYSCKVVRKRMSWAGKIDGDGKAYVERDEDGRRPRQGAGSSGDKKWTHKDEQIPGEIAAVA